MKIPHVKSWCAAALAAAVLSSSQAAVLVNLDATALTAGALPTWTNTGSLTGNFASTGSVVPAVGLVTPGAGGGIAKNAVTFANGTTFYVGPASPASITGTAARTIEVWALNPNFFPEECMVAWARRGGPDFTNFSFGYGSHGTWGALGGWGVGDTNWGTTWGANAGTAGTAVTTGAPSANQWHHLVITYNGTNVVLYSDSAPVNTVAKALNTHAGFPICIAAQTNTAGTAQSGGAYTATDTYAASLSIARVRVHDTALSAAQVRSQFVLEAPDFGKPLLAVVNSFTANPVNIPVGGSATLSWNVSTEASKPLTAISINNGAPAISGNSGSVVVSPTLTTTYTLTATNADGPTTSTITVNVLTPQPLVAKHRWSFNEPAATGVAGAALADSVGGQNAFLRMVAPAKAVATGTGITLSGGASHLAPFIDLPNGMASARVGGATFEGWATIAATQNQARFFEFGSSQANLGQDLIRPGGTGNGVEYLFLSASAGTTATQSRLEIFDKVVTNGVTATVTFTANAEVHFVVVYHPTGATNGGPQLRYYRNGVTTPVGVVDTALRLSDLYDNNCFLGRSTWMGDFNLQGTYNEFRVYDGPMAAADVATSFAAGPAVASVVAPAGTTIKHRWSFNNAAGPLEADTALTDSVGGAAAYVRSVETKLTGSQVLITGGTSANGSYIDLPNGIVSTRSGEATFEGWATILAISPWSRLMDFGSSLANAGAEIVAPGGTGNGEDYLFYSAHVATPGGIETLHNVRMAMRDNLGVEQGFTNYVPFLPGKPVHFAFTYRRTGGSTGGPSLRFYRDGKLLGFADATYTLSGIRDINNWLGRSQFMGDANVNGSYDEFRVYDGAMSDEDIAASFGSGPDAALQTPLHVDLFIASRTAIQAGESTELRWQVSNPGGGSVTVNTAPSSGVTGLSGATTVSPTQTTTYTLTAKSATQTRAQQVTVTVAPLAPTVTQRTYIIPYQAATPVTLAGTDPSSLPLTWTVVTPPTNGVLSGTAPNLTYTPNGGFTGTDTMLVSASNGAYAASGTMSLFVPADAPVAVGQTAAVAYQSALPLILVATDPDNETLTWSTVAGPVSGVLTGTLPNVTYTPNAGFTGTDSFTFKVNDGSFDSNTATVTLNVQAAAAPTNISLSDSQIKTNDSVGTMIARLQATNGTAPETLTYALVSGTGDTNNGDFTISGNQLVSARNFTGALGQAVSIRLRVTDSTGLSYEKVFTFTVGNPDLHVKINEIFYNTPDNTISGEFVELYNPLPGAVDVSGWKFTSGIAYTIPTGTPAIPSGGYLVVAQNPAVLEALYGYSGALGPWSGGLSSDGDTIELRDGANVKIDEVSYSVNTPWPTVPNGGGSSLELANGDLDNDLGGHWRSATSVTNPTVLLAKGASGWNYRPGTSEASTPITAWTSNSFTQDATWFTNGVAPIGLFKVNSNVSLATYAETAVTLGTQLIAAAAAPPQPARTDMATYVNATVSVVNNFTTNYNSVFFRKSFNITGTPPKALLLRIMRDDAAIVWINGVEVGRFGLSPTAPANPSADYDLAYELGNDPWMQTVLTNLSSVLVTGTNTLAIQGFAKKPRLRGNVPEAQDVPGTAGNSVVTAYNVFDFAIDAELSTVGTYRATPGAQNSSYATNAAPAVRNVSHTPAQPQSGQPITVTARISDRNGLGAAVLKYQICSAANFIPSELPRTVAEIQANIVANPGYLRLPNPAYELPANWTSLTMVDDGSVAGDTAGDGVYTAIIPAQAHRSLVRYRVFATDLPGLTAQYPAADDPSRNFACYVYNGVPAWNGGSAAFSPAQLETLPVYQMMMRSGDFDALLAYNISAADQLNDNQLTSLLTRRFENYQCAFVYDGKVYDHVNVRLRGGNSRYLGNGKRHFRFKFPKGYPFMAKDNKGNVYPRAWEDMLFNKMFGNKGDYDWGLPYEAGTKLWGLTGVPMPEHHWIHFRVVRSATEAPTATTGDFWGLYHALELPEGKNFLKARDLPEGNFYKMSDYIQNGEMDERYQALGAPEFAEDFENVRFNTHQFTPQADMEKYIDMPNYYAYNAVQEAIRHYDIFVEPTGRHRIKNLYWWFKPVAGNPLGQCVFMPYDWDASFGPSFNSGRDVVTNALYNWAWIPDSPTWPNIWGVPDYTMPDRTPMQVKHRNAMRHLRDLIFYRSSDGTGPLDTILNDAVNTVGTNMAAADAARWPAPGSASWRSITSKANDMLNFSFNGWVPLGNDQGIGPSVGPGGRAAYLDNIADGPDGNMLPLKPTLTYTGIGSYAVDGLSFAASAFDDPQGFGTFGAIQWRIGEEAAPTATADRIYEAAEIWGSGELTVNSPTLALTGAVLRVGHTYRARVRYLDNTGRASHWSDPVQFTAAASNYADTLYENLIVSEIMYKPAGLGATPGAAFEFVELKNISTTLTLNLDNVRITKGVNFDVPAGKSLAPGARIVIVADPVSFSVRYPSVPVAQILGPWDYPDSTLSNAGEELKISYGAGDTIHSIVYDDILPWPVEGNVTGYSIIYKGPRPVLGEVTDPQNLGTNWRGAYASGGNPGGTDSPTLTEWMAAIGQTDPLADPDKDGYNNCLAFAFGHDLRPFGITATTDVDGGGLPYLAMDYTRRRGGAEGVIYTPEVSTDLGTWNGGLADIVTITNNGDGTETVRVRVSETIQNGTRAFLKVSVTHQ
jgi:hypothetical protein